MFSRCPGLPSPRPPSPWESSVWLPRVGKGSRAQDLRGWVWARVGQATIGPRVASSLDGPRGITFLVLRTFRLSCSYLLFGSLVTLCKHKRCSSRCPRDRHGWPLIKAQTSHHRQQGVTSDSPTTAAAPQRPLGTVGGKA